MGGSHNRDTKDTFLNDDELFDEELLAEAIKRMENADLSKAIPHEEMTKMLGIT